MTPDLQSRVDALKQRAADFNSVMVKLASYKTAVKQNAQALQRWQSLMLDGAGIRSAIETVSRMVDGAQKFVKNVFQADALESIPFADNVVLATAGGALSSLNQFIDRARSAFPELEKLQQVYNALPEEKQKVIAALPDNMQQKSIVPALLLVAALGGLVLFGDKLKGDDDEGTEED